MADPGDNPIAVALNTLPGRHEAREIDTSSRGVLVGVVSDNSAVAQYGSSVVKTNDPYRRA